MVDKTRFLANIDNVPIKPDLAGLRYAIWAHAAAYSPTYVHMAEAFYEQARERLENHGPGSCRDFTSMPALQTQILVALYEITQAIFTRAWVSVSRATWLAQMLELHSMDRDEPLRVDQTTQHILPASTDTAELEERRRTFWAAFSLNTSVSVGIGWSPAIRIDCSEVRTFFTILCQPRYWMS